MWRCFYFIWKRKYLPNSPSLLCLSHSEFHEWRSQKFSRPWYHFDHGQDVIKSNDKLKRLNIHFGSPIMMGFGEKRAIKRKLWGHTNYWYDLGPTIISELPLFQQDMPQTYLKVGAIKRVMTAWVIRWPSDSGTFCGWGVKIPPSLLFSQNHREVSRQPTVPWWTLMTLSSNWCLHISLPYERELCDMGMFASSLDFSDYLFLSFTNVNDRAF